MRCLNSRAQKYRTFHLLGAALLALILTPVVCGAGPKDTRDTAVLSDLPEKMQKRLARSPKYFLREMAELIIGHGKGGAIAPEGVREYVSLERAKSRAYHLRRLIQADLNGDGMVAQSELLVLQRSVSTRQRGILELDFRRADSNVDAVVSAVELQEYARRRSMEEVSPEDVALYDAVFSFDLDASGDVTLDEVVAGLAALRAQADLTSGGKITGPTRGEQPI